MLLKYIRSGLIEEEHRVIFSDGTVVEKKLENLYYLRSCAKPLQASLMVDYSIPNKYSLTTNEVALLCASHAGEECHIAIAQKLLNKFQLTISDLKCGIHRPLSKTSDYNLKINGIEPNELYNNCVGKHLLFLAICRENGWDTKSYDNLNHPLQIAVRNRINQLCEVTDNYPVTKDGCGVPILSMPLNNMVKGYLNLFTNPKYEIIKSAFLNNPYIIGGEDRLDTEIIQNSIGLAAKTGAGGLCIVVNTNINKAIGIKVLDCDMKARRIALLEYLNRLGWANFQYENTIKTLHDVVVGEIKLEEL